MVQKFLGTINPSRQPVAYLFLVLVAYQVFFKGESIPEYWQQYVLEFLAASGLWGSVIPVVKRNDNPQNRGK